MSCCRSPRGTIALGVPALPNVCGHQPPGGRLAGHRPPDRLCGACPPSTASTPRLYAERGLGSYRPGRPRPRSAPTHSIGAAALCCRDADAGFNGESPLTVYRMPSLCRVGVRAAISWRLHPWRAVSRPSRRPALPSSLRRVCPQSRVLFESSLHARSRASSSGCDEARHLCLCRLFGGQLCVRTVDVPALDVPAGSDARTEPAPPLSVSAPTGSPPRPSRLCPLCAPSGFALSLL